MRVEPADELSGVGIGLPERGEREQVSVGMQRSCRRLDLERPETEVDRALDVGVLTTHQLIEPVDVRGIERELGLQPAHHREAGIEAGLDRALPKQVGGEGVDRLDAGAIERAGCRLDSGPPLGVGLARGPCSSASRTRAESSAAAFSVKVITTSSSTSARPEASSSTIRPTSEVVFPVPAPASTHRHSSRFERISVAHCFVDRRDAHGISLNAASA